jgi:hypothetical protein
MRGIYRKPGASALQALRFCANRFLQSAAQAEPPSDAALSPIGGQTNRPYCGRLAKRYGPEPSQIKSSRSRRACRRPRMRSRIGTAATFAPHGRPVRRSPAACQQPCKPDRPSRSVRIQASSHVQRQQIRDGAPRRLTSASSDTLAPFDKLISIAPRHAHPTSWLRHEVGRRRRREHVQHKQLYRDEGGRAPRERRGHDRLLVRSLAPPIAHTSRERRIHLKERLAFSPRRRATAATEAPCARASSTILLRSSRFLVRRSSPDTPHFGGHLGLM